VIPNELTPRDQSVATIVGIGLFAAFLLISIAKLLRSEIFIALIKANLKTVTITNYVNDEYPINKRESFLLAINYLICFSLVLFILVEFPGVHQKNELLFVTFFPLLLLIGSIAIMFWIGLITGEYKIAVKLILFKIIGAQLLGLVFFALALAWTLVSIDETIFLNLAIWMFLVESILRVYKSGVAVYLVGVPWYYIILYFCTLEILPLFIVFYFFGESFGLHF